MRTWSSKKEKAFSQKKKKKEKKPKKIFGTDGARLPVGGPG